MYHFLITAFNTPYCSATAAQMGVISLCMCLLALGGWFVVEQIISPWMAK